MSGSGLTLLDVPEIGLARGTVEISGRLNATFQRGSIYCQISQVPQAGSTNDRAILTGR